MCFGLHTLKLDYHNRHEKSSYECELSFSGQEICDCYGRLTAFTEEKRDVRVASLRKHFGFECQCQACTSVQTSRKTAPTEADKAATVVVMRMMEQGSHDEARDKLGEMMAAAGRDVKCSSMTPLLDRLMKSIFTSTFACDL